jgi:thioredoxin-dependent peroxiredoxin
MKTNMKIPLIAGALTVLLCASAGAALKTGDSAPDFKANASLAGKAFPFSLKQALKKGPVVVYFYPSAYTGGCNIQAHTFAENIDKFTAAGASVVGVSLDSIARLNDFSADPAYCAGELAVASDADGKIAKAYDLAVRDAVPGRKDSRGADLDHGFAERTTFVVTPGGKIAATVGGVEPAANVEQALQAVQKLARSKATAL